MKNIVLLLLCLSALSCNTLRNKYFTKLTDDEFLEYKMADQVDSIMIDDTYSLYLRQLCRKRPPTNYYSSRNPNLTASVDYCNCDDKSVTYPKERLEIQYLLVSPSQKKFIYITTFHPGIIDNISLYDYPLFNLDNHININYFNTFFFGEIENSTLQFSDKVPKQILSKVGDADMIWNFKMSADGSILEITDVGSNLLKKPQHHLAASTVKPSLNFYKKKNFTIGISNAISANSLSPNNNNFLENKTMYFLTSNKRKGKRVDGIAFCFNTSYEEPATQIRKLVFGSHRLKSSPIVNPN